MPSFRELRRNSQAIPREECLAILDRNENGVLALLGDGDYPYAVPLNYVRTGERLFFHCAMEGHKIDAVRRHDKASFCVIVAAQLDAQAYTTRFRSVIAFGRVQLLNDAEACARALEAIGDRFCPATPDQTRMEIRGALDHTAIIVFSMEHISGKESRALAQERRSQ